MSRRLESLLANQVRERPQATALIAGDDRRTFTELHEQSRAVASALAEQGVVPGDRVVVCGAPSADLPAAILGVLMAGACCVPLDPEFPEKRMQQIVTAAAASCILVEARLESALDGLGAPCLAFDGEFPPAEMIDRAVQGDEQAAFVFFTSGSMGSSKGVILSHRALLSRQVAEQERIELSPGDRMLFRTTISFDVLIRELFWPLIAGCPLVVAPEGTTRDPHGLAATIGAHDVSVAAVSPTLLRLMLRVPEIASCADLRHVLSGGETLTKELQDAFYAQLPGAQLYNIYGPTEAFTATFWSCPRDWSEEVVPIGHPTDLAIALVDSAGDPVEPGQIGEIWITGVGVADGYLNAPEENAARFSVDPRSPTGERRYRSGDLAYQRTDGALVFSGRLDDQVKLHGQRVELSEVERTLARLPGVRDAAVAVRTDAGSTPALVAYVVVESEDVDATQLLELAAAELPSFMVPSAAVRLNALPVGVTGKLDRGRLPSPSTRPDGVEPAARPEDHDLTDLEVQILSGVRHITGVPDVGLDDDLRALPIDSLRLIELMLEVEEVSETQLELADLHAVRSVRELCECAVAASQAG